MVAVLAGQPAEDNLQDMIVAALNPGRWRVIQKEASLFHPLLLLGVPLVLLVPAQVNFELEVPSELLIAVYFTSEHFRLQGWKNLPAVLSELVLADLLQIAVDWMIEGSLLVVAGLRQEELQQLAV